MQMVLIHGYPKNEKKNVIKKKYDYLYIHKYNHYHELSNKK